MKMHARADAPSENAQSWPEDIFGILQRFDVRQVAYVPDAGHSQLIERVLSNRDGAFIMNRVRGALGYQPICGRELINSERVGHIPE